MERTLITELGKHVDETVSISGSVDVRRDQGKMVFFDFRDRSGVVQGVVLPGSAAIETAKETRNEFVVRVEGKVNKRPEKNVQAGKQNGDIELEVLGIEILSAAQALPFDTDADINLDTMLDYRPLTVRRKREQAVFKVQHEIINGFREYLDGQGFTEFQAPKLVGDDAEGGAGVFKVEYFKDRSAYLATSPQLYKQMMVGAFERVYTTGPQFRAEKHSTTRHLNEISMLDFEMGFIEDHTDVMNLVQGALQHISTRVVKNAEAAFAATGSTPPLVPASFPVLKLREAQKILGVAEEPDLEPEHERKLCEWAKTEKGSDFIFVTHYPVSKRPFYTMEDPEDPGFTKSFDLLFRGVEILSGSQRVHDYENLINKMSAKGLDPEKFAFYLMAFKYGLPPHGGIGMGLERLTQKYLELPNVKEATLFPRDMNRIDVLLSTLYLMNPTISKTDFHIRRDFFEGPLELLLELIDKRKLLVNDLALATVTDEFIQHVRNQAEFPIEQTTNFISVAATLLLIKSKSLLPDLALTPDEEGDINDLQNRLAEYEKFRDASRDLSRLFGRKVLVARGEKAPEVIFAPAKDMTLVLIEEALMRALEEREKPEDLPEARVKPMVTIEEMMSRLGDRVQAALTLSFNEFSGMGKKEKVEVIVSFLALLELVKQGAVDAAQHADFADIRITNTATAVPRYG